MSIKYLSLFMYFLIEPTTIVLKLKIAKYVFCC